MQNSIEHCVICNLYNREGDWRAIVQAQHRALNGEYKDTWADLIGDIRNWGVDGQRKYENMYQKLCQAIFKEKAYYDQCDTMRAGPLYQGHDPEKAIKKIWTTNDQ